MNIQQIGQERAFQNNTLEGSLPKQAQRTAVSGSEEDIRVDISATSKDAPQGYDRTGSLTGGKKASDEEKASGTGNKTRSDGQDLSEEEKKQVDELKARDREVRAHEQAHMAAGGNLVRGGAHYTYQRGPDGSVYAVGGEVSIDTSEEKTPEQTVQKMQRVQAAALAPAEPSGQDRAVAAAAARKAQMARAEMSQEPVPHGPPVTGKDIEHIRPDREDTVRPGYEKASGTQRPRNLFHLLV